MMTTIDNQTIEDLITAFSHKLTIECNFYWKMATTRVIEICMSDYALIYTDCVEDYESGLDKDEEREVKEAIIAIEKKRDTHLYIPRVSVDERIEIMQKFIATQTDLNIKENLQLKLDKLVELKDASMLDHFKNGFKVGFDMNNLTIGTEEHTNDWTDFYRSEIKHKVYDWLAAINARA